MPKPAAKTPPPNDLHGSDLYAWSQQQARLLRDRQFADLDLANIAEEIEGVGGSQKQEIRNRTQVILAHLLNWAFQPGGRGASWRGTLTEQRLQIVDLTDESPSLRRYPVETMAKQYRGARLIAAKETGIALGVFPEACPFTPDEVFDVDFFPENRSFE
jgi:hypothetical protein